MKEPLKELKTEADVINLIGYNTPMKFNFTSEGIFTFNTIIPDESKQGIIYYEVEFFTEEGRQPDFFAYDSFSNFLLKYRVHTVTALDESTLKRTQLYFRTYE